MTHQNYTVSGYEGPVLIRANDFRKAIGNVSPVYLWRNRDTLPKPVIISGRKFFLQSEVQEYVDRRAAGRATQLAPRRACSKKDSQTKRNNSK